jgi:hypothetical protein
MWSTGSDSRGSEAAATCVALSDKPWKPGCFRELRNPGSVKPVLLLARDPTIAFENIAQSHHCLHVIESKDKTILIPL